MEVLERMLVFNVQDFGGIPVIGCQGEIDVYSAPWLKGKILECIDEDQTKLIIDLSKVKHFSAAALTVLVWALVNFGRDNLCLVIPPENPIIARIFQVTELDAEFVSRPSVNEAIQHLCKNCRSN